MDRVHSFAVFLPWASFQAFLMPSDPVIGYIELIQQKTGMIFFPGNHKNRMAPPLHLLNKKPEKMNIRRMPHTNQYLQQPFPEFKPSAHPRQSSLSHEIEVNHSEADLTTAERISLGVPLGCSTRVTSGFPALSFIPAFQH